MGEKFCAATVCEPGIIELMEYEKPKLGPGSWLLKIEMAGICGTDPHLIDNRKLGWAENSYPFVPGHEFVGRIDEVGPGFLGVDSEGQQINVGDLVIASGDTMKDPTVCTKCYYCRTGLPIFCVNRSSANLPPILQGWQRGWAEYRYMHGDELILRYPPSMPLEVATLIEPLSIAIHAFERAADPGNSWLYQGMGPGKIVAIQGAGPIGILLVILAQLSGAWKTIVVGAPDNRFELCKEFGADEIISIEKLPDAQDRIKAVKALTPFQQGADVVIEAAGVPGAFAEGIEMVRDRGTMVELGHFTDRGRISVNPMTLCAKSINLFGVFGGGPAGFVWGKRVVERYRAKIPFERIVTHKFPLSEVKEALKTAKNLESMKTVLVP